MGYGVKPSPRPRPHTLTPTPNTYTCAYTHPTYTRLSYAIGTRLSALLKPEAKRKKKQCAARVTNQREPPTSQPLTGRPKGQPPMDLSSLEAGEIVDGAWRKARH